MKPHVHLVRLRPLPLYSREKPCALCVEADKLQMVHPIASVLLIPLLLPGSPATGLFLQNLLPIC